MGISLEHSSQPPGPIYTWYSGAGPDCGHMPWEKPSHRVTEWQDLSSRLGTQARRGLEWPPLGMGKHPSLLCNSPYLK